MKNFSKFYVVLLPLLLIAIFCVAQGVCAKSVSYQTAGIAEATGIIGLSAAVIALGKWILSNIVWIIVLILATVFAYIWGRTSYKEDKK